MRADYLALRTEAVLLETQYAALWRLSGPGAWLAVDALLSCDAAVRSGRLRHGLVLDEGGRIAADAYLGRLGDDLLIWHVDFNHMINIDTGVQHRFSLWNSAGETVK